MRQQQREVVSVKDIDVLQQDRDDLMGAADTQRSTRKRIVLDVCNDQCVMPRRFAFHRLYVWCA